MQETGRVIRSVARRLFVLRARERFERYAPPVAGAVLAVGIALRLAGRDLPTSTLLLAGAAAVVVAAIVAALRTRVGESAAAAEADRLLGTRERLLTACALRQGRAADPLGFAPALEAEADRIARGVDRSRLRAALPVRPGPRTVLPFLLLALLLLVPLLPAPSPAVAGESEPLAVRKEKERVAEALRRVERRFAKTEIEAREADMKDLEKLALQIRRETARLAEERPTRAKAIARLAELERRAADAARDLAKLPRAEAREDDPVTDRELRELREAIENFLESDPAAALRDLTALSNRLAEAGMDGASAESLARLADALRALGEALGGMKAATGGENGPDGRESLTPSMTPEQMQRLADALDRMSRALASGQADADAFRDLLSETRSYRDLQPSPEEIEEMIRAMEELAKMCEAGGDLAGARAMMGGAMGGLGSLPLPGRGPGASRFPGTGPSAGGAGTDTGPGTGGAGRGRGGDPGTNPNDVASRPEFDPGMLSGEGAASFFRTVRRMPSREESPREYEQLVRQASREAEEAIRRGDIPRRYREYVRRFFGDAEGR